LNTFENNYAVTDYLSLTYSLVFATRIFYYFLLLKIASLLSIGLTIPTVSCFDIKTYFSFLSDSYFYNIS